MQEYLNMMLKKAMENKDKPREVNFNCPKCEDTGIIVKDNIAYICECEKKRVEECKFRQGLEEGNLKERHFEDFKIDVYRKENQRQMTAIKNLVKSYIKHFDKNTQGKGLYLYSNCPGSGKTTMGNVIGTEMIKKGYKVEMITLTELSETLKSQFKDNTNKEMLDRLIYKSDLLIIDDLAAESSKDWLEDYLFYIVNARLNHSKAIIYSSNKRILELPYNKRLISRISEGVLKGELPFPEEDLRMKLKGEKDNEFLKLLGGNVDE